jgi:hypothetical protein
MEMQTKKFTRQTFVHVLLGSACAIGAFAVGLESAGHVDPFDRSQAALSTSINGGDVNADGRTDAQDAEIILEVAQGERTVTADDIRRGDVDGDGQLTMNDAIRILHSLSGR